MASANGTTTKTGMSFKNTSTSGVRGATSGNKSVTTSAKRKGDQLSSVRGVMNKNIKGPGV